MNPEAILNAARVLKTMRPKMAVRPQMPDMPQMRASGGAADKIAREKRTPCHTGLITMAVGGRTDHIPMNVLEGSYVLPADIVSGLGEGNTLAGSKIIDNMFTAGPFGTKVPNVRFAAPQQARTPFSSTLPFDLVKQYQSGMSIPSMLQKRTAAEGGAIEAKNYKPVPIVAAGGEYVIHPDVVKKLGGGDVNKGHNYLDNFVKYVRNHLIKTLKKLPGPKRD
jgi:hypothetical protein